MRITLFICIVVALLVMQPPALHAQEPPQVWFTESLARLTADTLPGTASTVGIQAARGETESFQVAVRSGGGDLSGVNVYISDLDGPDGAILSTTSVVRRYRQERVYALGSANWPGFAGFMAEGDLNPPEGDGWYYDPLIPFEDPLTGTPLTSGERQAADARIPEGVTQPYWIDITIPRDAPAGTYIGALDVTSDQGDFSTTITVTVWDFTLPLVPLQHSSFQIWNADQSQAAIMLLQHRMQPLDIDPTDGPRLVEAWGLRDTSPEFWGGIDWQACQAGEQIGAPPTLAEVQARVAALPPDLFLYNHTVDEIDACLEINRDGLIAWARVLHAAGVRQLVTMIPTDRLLYTTDDGATRSAVDIWVVMPAMFDENAGAVIAAQGRSEQVWSYPALVQDNYAPKWQIDYAPINYRIWPGFLNYTLGITGFMYWAVDFWTPDPWADVNVDLDESGDWVWPPSDGMLFYPGDAVGLPGGLAPSLRAKWARDGFEDYEYAALLASRGQAALAQQIVAGAATSWRDWTRDPQVIADRRAALAGAILAAGSG